MSIADLRKDYSHSHLLESDISTDPLDQFRLWFDDAIRAELPEPNAMSLATASKSGRPSSRIVLLKGFDPRGLVWYTNYDSHKGQELAANPVAALLFHWVELERQVRLEGRVERVSADESDAYFNSRPLKSRIGAIASAQSLPIESREALEQQFASVESSNPEQPKRPVNWGGYRLIPDTMEFWQGRRSRLHDRIVYMLLPDGRWQHQRLQP